MTYIDLTHLLHADTPIFPGDPEFTIKPAATFTDQNNLGHSISCGTHTGTHIDAPAHMIEGAKTLDTFSPAQLIGRGVYIQISSTEISAEDLQTADIQQGDIIVLDTGMASKYGGAAYYESFPVLTDAAASYLIEKRVKMVGIDTASFDRDQNFPIHKKLLGTDILLIENIANIQQLAGFDFTIYALPMRFDLDGAPARVIAEVH
jgi:arylformamidase